jgi:hypothetical protein
MNNRIKHLQKQIEIETNKIINCDHDYGDVIYDPDVELVGYGSVQDGAGSDPHWSYQGYYEKERPRWSRTCNICGNVDYTYKQEPVITGYKPKF